MVYIGSINLIFVKNIRWFNEIYKNRMVIVMDKQMKNIKLEILSGKRQEELLPYLFNYMASSYSTHASVRLAMHYYSFYEFYCEEDNWSEHLNKIAGNINKFILENLLQKNNPSQMEEAVRKIDTMRNEVMKRMNVLSSYTDIFQIYEYILNRLEYQFREEHVTVNEEEFAKEILRYIFDSQDNVIINEKIKDMIGQLPVRMTKQKYLEIISDSFKLYTDGEKSALDTFLYMLRTSAMLYEPEGMGSFYTDLWEQKEFFARLKYKELTKNEFEEAIEVLKRVSKFLETEVTACYSMQEIVNEIYTLLLCNPYAGMVCSEWEDQEKAASKILVEVNQYFLSSEKKELPEQLQEQLMKMEGVQESLLFDLSSLEEVLYELDQNRRTLIEGLMLEKLLNVLLRSRDLLSNSIFIDFNVDLENQKVTEELLMQERNKLIEELAFLLTGHDKIIGRAVMANTLNKLPVFFHSHKEVMDYVRYSFDRCTDPREKMACIEIIKDMMIK
ncbi:MAG: hypothetical protein K0S47_1926 [Herbinix sp.]|jgi:hypothetical protein|nr:hypothetical protein [Herbinix sp.]